MSMMVTNSLYSGYAAQNTTDKTEKKETKETAVKSSEDKLSSRAADYLAELRKSRSNFDFIVADAGDDHKALVKQSNKEYTVIYTSAELEKMASDPKYAAERNQAIETILSMTKKICEQEGYVSAFGQNNQESIVKSIGVSVDDNGSMKIFAELEKSADKQKERIEKAREKKAEEKKNSEKADKKKRYEYSQNGHDKKGAVKKTTVEASTVEELLEKIRNLDWNKVKGDWKTAGSRFDYSV